MFTHRPPTFQYASGVVAQSIARPPWNSTAIATVTTSAAMISQGVSFLGRLAQTLADEQATRQLVDEITEKDEATGKTYLKIPVESEDVVKNAMKLLGGLLGKL